MSKREYNDNNRVEQSKDSPSTSKITPKKQKLPNAHRRTLTFLDLSADCLIDLFKSLKLKDQIQCALMCKDLLSFYAREMAPSRKKLSKDEVWTLAQLRINELKFFLEAASPFVEEVDIADTRLEGKILFRLFCFCKNIKRVKMDGLCRASAQMSALFAYGWAVEKLNIAGCNLEDEDLIELRKLRQLRVLRLDFNNDLTGKYISTLTNLEELYLVCDQIEEQPLLKIMQRCSKLRILDIRSLNLNAAVSQALCQYCHNISTFRFTHNCDVVASDIAKLPKLRTLMMEAADLSFLLTLAEHRAEQLEDLRLMEPAFNEPIIEPITRFKNLKIFYCQLEEQFLDELVQLLCALENVEKLGIANATAIEDNMLLKVLRDCGKLTYMAVLMCSNISEDFVFDAIELLKERSTLRKPFVLVVHKTAITDAILKMKRYRDATKILKLNIIHHDLYDFPNAFPCDC